MINHRLTVNVRKLLTPLTLKRLTYEWNTMPNDFPKMKTKKFH